MSSPHSSEKEDVESVSKAHIPEKEEEEEKETSTPEEEKGQEKEEETPTPVDPAAAAQWQAVWSPEYNAYYFYNASTQQTTWTNPLVPDPNPHLQESSLASTSASTSTGTQQQETPKDDEGEESSGTQQQQPAMSSVAAQHAAIHAAAVAQGIDPLLARLDPSLVASATAGPGGSVVGGALPTFTAQFNARTGRFTAASLPSSASSSSQPVRTPAHLSEYERAKRMSSFYFDVDKWEEDLAKRGGRLMGEEGDGDGADGGGDGSKKRKRPSKKDIERFKEQKKQKKIAKTAWLRT